MLEELYEEFQKFSRSEVSHFRKLDQQRKTTNENEGTRPFKYSEGKEGTTSFDTACKQVHSIDSSRFCRKCEIMALLDCFSGYYQIWLREEDQEKTSFITAFGTYCYLRMFEGLKNGGPTFYRMTKVILKEQIERNAFAYVDDIVVARKKKETQL
jgi:hypothetical protein